MQLPSIEIIRTGNNLVIKPRRKDDLTNSLRTELFDAMRSRKSLNIEKLEKQFFQNYPPLLQMKFRCTECDIEADYSWHCKEHMELDVNKNMLICEIYGITQEVPIHHNRKNKNYCNKEHFLNGLLLNTIKKNPRIILQSDTVISINSIRDSTK